MVHLNNTIMPISMNQYNIIAWQGDIYKLQLRNNAFKLLK
jgi:hypothetical protein